MKTAVEYLVYEIFIVKRWMPLSEDELNDIFKQAKEMEKEQIETAFEEGMFHHTNGLCPDEYYNETFKSE